MLLKSAPETKNTFGYTYYIEYTHIHLITHHTHHMSHTLSSITHISSHTHHITHHTSSHITHHAPHHQHTPYHSITSTSHHIPHTPHHFLTHTSSPLQVKSHVPRVGTVHLILEGSIDNIGSAKKTVMSLKSRIHQLYLRNQQSPKCPMYPH